MQNASRTAKPIWTRFSLNGCLEHWLRPYWNWRPWVKGQGHSGSKSIFLPFLLLNSLLTSQLYISALVYLINLKFGMPLWYVLCRFVQEFYKNKLGMTSWWRHISFFHTNVHISNSSTPTNFIFGTDIQQHKIHLITKVQVALINAEGHRWRSKVT